MKSILRFALVLPSVAGFTFSISILHPVVIRGTTGHHGTISSSHRLLLKHYDIFFKQRRARTMTNLNGAIFNRESKVSSVDTSVPTKRFQRSAPSEMAIETPCILTIHGKQYNMTSWAKAHPGGSNILRKFHGKDATKAFFGADHSPHAIGMLEQFLVHENNRQHVKKDNDVQIDYNPEASRISLSLIRSKLFTKEDPIGIHKYCGIFALLHFTYRFLQSYVGDPAGGFGKKSSALVLMCMVPHTMLSFSSLIFHTVPRERIVGSPMIVSISIPHLNFVFN